MKTAIIGAGNMGGAIARGLAKGTIIPAGNIIVSNPTQGKLDKLKAEFPALQVTNDNQEAAAGADMIIFAVKPWLMEPVIKELELKGTEILISVAAGIPFEELTHYVADKEMTMFRLIPNTAISEMESMTLIASRNATKEQEQLMLDIFNQMGLAMLIPEEKIAATTAMTSCGIAYVLKYIQAAMQAGVEMGIYPQRRHAHGGTICERGSRADSEQRHAPQLLRLTRCVPPEELPSRESTSWNMKDSPPL